MVIEHVQDDPASESDWDEFIRTCPRGHPCQLTTWLRSFQAYGFPHHLIIARDHAHSSILGGAGLVEVGRWPMLAIVVPMGPIVSHGSEHLVVPIVESALEHARNKRAFLLQLRVPQTTQAALETIPGEVRLPHSNRHARGSALDVAVAPNGLLRLEFPQYADPAAWQEALLSRFSARTRRDVRKSLRSGLSIREATDRKLLEKAYAVIVRNSVEQGYTSRTWKQFGSTLIAQVERGQAAVLMAYHGDTLLGVHYGIIAGQRYTYIMGGTVRTSPTETWGIFCSGAPC